jgi:hypothetical protein
MKKHFRPAIDVLRKYGQTEEEFVKALYTKIYEHPSLLSLHAKPDISGHTQPIHVGTIKLLSLQTIYIVDAIHEAKGNKDEAIRILRSNLQIAKKKGKKTAEGTFAKDECLEAIASLEKGNLGNCTIPTGSHLAYEFAGNKLHHAVYIGSNIVVEMRNFQTKKGILSQKSSQFSIASVSVSIQFTV